MDGDTRAKMTWHELFRTMDDLLCNERQTVEKDRGNSNSGEIIMRREIKQRQGHLAEQPVPPIFELGPPVPFPTFCARSCAYPHLTSSDLYLARPRRGLLTSFKVRQGMRVRGVARKPRGGAARDEGGEDLQELQYFRVGEIRRDPNPHHFFFNLWRSTWFKNVVYFLSWCDWAWRILYGIRTRGREGSN